MKNLFFVFSMTAILATPAVAQQPTSNFDQCVIGRAQQFPVNKDTMIPEEVAAILGICEGHFNTDWRSVWQSLSQEFQLQKPTVEAEITALLVIQNSRARMANIASSILVSKRPK